MMAALWSCTVESLANHGRRRIKELLGTKSHNEVADTHTGKYAAHTIGGEGSHLEQATSTGHAADTTGHTSTTTGTAGPHDSSIFNKADSTVDPGYSRTEGLSSGTTGYTTGDATTAQPHDSNLPNKVDPKVDSDRSRTGGGLPSHAGGVSGPHITETANRSDSNVPSGGPSTIENAAYHHSFTESGADGADHHHSVAGAVGLGGAGNLGRGHEDTAASGIGHETTGSTGLRYTSGFSHETANSASDSHDVGSAGLGVAGATDAFGLAANAHQSASQSTGHGPFKADSADYVPGTSTHKPNDPSTGYTADPAHHGIKDEKSKDHSGKGATSATSVDGAAYGVEKQYESHLDNRIVKNDEHTHHLIDKDGNHEMKEHKGFLSFLHRDKNKKYSKEEDAEFDRQEREHKLAGNTTSGHHATDGVHKTHGATPLVDKAPGTGIGDKLHGVERNRSAGAGSGLKSDELNPAAQTGIGTHNTGMHGTTIHDSGLTGHYDQSGASRSPKQSGVSGDHSLSSVTGGHGQSNVIGNLSDVSGAHHHAGLDGDNNTPGVTGSDLPGTQDKSKLNHAEGHSTTHSPTQQSGDLPGHGPDRRNTTSGLHTDPAIHHVKEVGKHNSTPPS
ncbi:hypothetical protein B0O99DRAFT_645906 [Bisporella sp. PMI_857]|nr:hypothetical protein B0O99DRAFT_645906 [Bisporella sp. PMI_857]